MRDADPTDDENGRKMDRIREIIAPLEDGEVSLERTTELRDEGKELLVEVEERLDLGERAAEDREDDWGPEG